MERQGFFIFHQTRCIEIRFCYIEKHNARHGFLVQFSFSPIDSIQTMKEINLE
ncbi:hypothetical protein SAMN05216332_102341 [Nitrosospira briensis]|nr:hypothetical protein SAMN05216332_102341 [Nitrosospira briensis]